MIDLAVPACAVVSSVGLSAPAACAAIRCGLNNFAETRFMDENGEWIMAAEAPLETSLRGRAKLAHMAAMALREALSGLEANDIKETPLLLCLAETQRAGRIPDQDQQLLNDIRKITGLQLHRQSMVISAGRVSGVRAVETAQALMAAGRCRRCVIAGVDTLLTAPTLSAYEKENRILTNQNSDGFIPGEAGAAMLLAPAGPARGAPVAIRGFGFGMEKAHIRSGQPLRADGMVQAVKSALTMAGRELGDLDFRICDISGEQYYFKEAALALARLLRKRKAAFDIWQPADSIGETGAAIVPVVLAVASTAVTKGYAKGNGILCHFANDDGQRGALVVTTTDKK